MMSIRYRSYFDGRRERYDEKKKKWIKEEKQPGLNIEDLLKNEIENGYSYGLIDCDGKIDIIGKVKGKKG